MPQVIVTLVCGVISTNCYVIYTIYACSIQLGSFYYIMSIAATKVKASVQCSQKSDVHEGVTSEGIYLASCVKCFCNSQCSEVRCL